MTSKASNSKNGNREEAVSRPLEVVAGTQDKPLAIGEIEIPCYVLEDETRVLSERGVHKTIQISRGGKRSHSENDVELPRFASQNWLKPFISHELDLSLRSPIRFTMPHGGIAYGYPAAMLVDLCNAILEARKNGAVTDRQADIVNRAETIIRGLATVGIIALIDEATGYQDIRNRRALATILERFLAEELRPWTRTFPYEFYEEICRLRGWPMEYAINRPQVVAKYTNDFVYERLAPGVLEELRSRNPMLPSGYRRYKHTQWFNEEFGHPRLREHIYAVMALMRSSDSWDSFVNKLDRAFPKKNQTIPMDLGEF